MQPLVAVLLVVRSRPGPQLVYRYPHRAQPRAAQTLNRNDDDDSASESDGDINRIASLHGKHKSKPSHESAQTTHIHLETDAALDDYLGFSKDSLEKLLAPGIWCDRRKFEVCLDGLTFVGHPIHAHEDGKWTRKEKDGARPAVAAREDLYGDYTNFGITITEPTSPVQRPQDFKHIPDSFESPLGRSVGESVNSGSTTSTAGAEPLSMFNVVFVFDVAGDETVDQGIENTYKHVVKKLSRALHYCQKQSNYVGVETKRLLSLYARAKQERTFAAALEQQVLETSELAWALKEVFDTISVGNIAGIHLNGQAISLHIPPRQRDEQQEIGLDPHAGLLLLEDKGTLLRELSHPDASPLAHFIREHTPTKSLQKLAARLGMSIDETMYLARHLAKWRKARTVMPLHPRNTYIVQPSAPADRLTEFANDYARRFPGLPSLPQMLKFLSGKPLRYGMLMPSRDHRAPYMEILAYLVRHEFVGQLKTYAWLRRIPRSVKAMKRETGEKEVVNQNRRPLSVASLLSPQLRPVEDDSASVSSDRTAIPILGPERSKAPVPMDLSLSASDETADKETDPWDVILDPLELDDEEAQCLLNVQDAVEDDELQERLPLLFKYFDGEEALESIAAREGLKRSLVERWVDLLQREELIATFRRL